MSELKSIDQASLVLAFLVPGVIILFARAQFLTGRLPTPTEGVLAYFTVSVLYHAFTLPVLTRISLDGQPLAAHPTLWLLLTVLGPACFGLAIGLNARFGWSRRLLGRAGINTLHVMPTAWDWKFADTSAFWVLVTLKDGTTYAGFCGQGSFMSSDPKERDFYIERIYDIGDDNVWRERGDNGLLVLHGEIRTLQFWPDKE